MSLFFWALIPTNNPTQRTHNSTIAKTYVHIYFHHCDGGPRGVSLKTAALPLCNLKGVRLICSSAPGRYPYKDLCHPTYIHSSQGMISPTISNTANAKIPSPNCYVCNLSKKIRLFSDNTPIVIQYIQSFMNFNNSNFTMENL